MENLFWAIPGKLAGRVGPNHEPWYPAALYRGGVRGILTLNSGMDVVPELIESAGIRHHRLAFLVGIPPEERAFEIAVDLLPRAFRWYQEHSEAGAVVAHCSFGKDRTGLFLSYALMLELGLDADAAFTMPNDVTAIVNYAIKMNMIFIPAQHIDADTAAFNCAVVDEQAARLHQHTDFLCTDESIYFVVYREDDFA